MPIARQCSHRLFPLLSALGLALSLAASPLPAADQARPQWWLREGIVFVGNWEPLSFRIRGGNVPRNFQDRYRWEHEESTVRSLKAAGVNTAIAHFYKGLGPEQERRDKEYTRKLVDNCKKHGMFVGAYIGSTLFSETLYQEFPAAAGWIQQGRDGEPIIYADQYYRDRADFTQPGYGELIKSQVTEAVRDYGMNLIHFDNFYTMFPLEAGYTEHIQQRFREYLERKYTPERRWERLGFSEVAGVRPPRVENRPMDPVKDPLVQEWITFRVEVLAEFVGELSRHIRALSPEAVVEFNPHGLWGQNSAYTNGMDHARLLPHSDIFWSEDPDHAHYYPQEDRLVSKIRSYKLGRHFGNALFSYNNSPLELAEALAFNRMCPGDVDYTIMEPGRETDRRFLAFFHEHKALYRDLETIDDVAVLRDFESMTFGGWEPFLATVQAEQALIQSRTPFTPAFDQDTADLGRYRAVVLAEQQNLSDAEIARLKAYLEGGGALVVVGATGRYDEWRRERQLPADNFWQRLGVAAPDRPVRLSLGRGSWRSCRTWSITRGSRPGPMRSTRTSGTCRRTPPSSWKRSAGARAAASRSRPRLPPMSRRPSTARAAAASCTW